MIYLLRLLHKKENNWTGVVENIKFEHGMVTQNCPHSGRWLAGSVRMLEFIYLRKISMSTSEALYKTLGPLGWENNTSIF